MQVNMREEELPPRDLHVVKHTDESHMPAGPSGMDGLHHRLLSADCLDGRVRAKSIREVLDPCHTFIAALGDNVGCAELQREFLPIRVAAHRDDALRTHLLGRENGE